MLEYIMKHDAQIARVTRTFFQAFFGVLATKLVTGYPPSWGATFAAAAIAGGTALFIKPDASGVPKSPVLTAIALDSGAVEGK